MPTFGEIFAQGVDYKVRRLEEIRQLLIAQENAAPSIRAAQWRMVAAEQQQAVDLQQEIEKMRQDRIKASAAVDEAWQRSTSPIIAASISAAADRDVEASRSRTDMATAAYKAIGSQGQEASDAAAQAYSASAKDDVIRTTASPGTKALDLWRTHYAPYDTPSTHDELVRSFNERIPVLISPGGQGATTETREATSAFLSSMGFTPLTQAEIQAKKASSQGQALNTIQGLAASTPTGLGSTPSYGGVPPRPTMADKLGLGSAADVDPYIKQAAYYRLLVNQPGFLTPGNASKPLSIQEYDAALLDPKNPLHDALQNEVARMRQGSVIDIGTYGDPRFAELNLQAQALARRSQEHQAQLLALDAQRTSPADIENRAREIYAGSFGSPAMKRSLAEDQAKAARLRDALGHAPDAASARAYLSPNPLGATPPEDPTLLPEYDAYERARTPGPVIAPEPTARTLSPEAFAYLQDSGALSPIPGSTTDFMAHGNRVREDTAEAPTPGPRVTPGRATFGDVLQEAADETTPSFIEDLIPYMGEDHKPKVKFSELPPDEQEIVLANAREAKENYVQHIDDWRNDQGDAGHASDVLRAAQFYEEMGVPDDDAPDLPNWSTISKDREAGETQPLQSGEGEVPLANPQTKDASVPLKAKERLSPQSQSQLESIGAATQGMQIASVSKATQTDPLQLLKQKDGRVLLSKKEISLLSDLASRANQPAGKDLTQALMGVTGSSRWLNDQIRDQAKTYYASLVSLKKGE